MYTYFIIGVIFACVLIQMNLASYVSVFKYDVPIFQFGSCICVICMCILSISINEVSNLWNCNRLQEYL